VIRKIIYKDQPFHIELGESYNSVSLAYMNNCNHEKNLEYSLKSLEIAKLVFIDHPNQRDLANSYNNFSTAYAYANNRDYEQFLDYSLMAFDIYKKK
jgi:hypothetical protein